MNRRAFLTTATAAAAIPALPTLPFASSAPAASTTAARFWAIYHTAIQGDVTPALIARSSGLSTAKAAAIRADLIATNVIRPTSLASASLASSATKLSQSSKPGTLIEKARTLWSHLSEPETEPETEPEDEPASDPEQNP